MNEILSAQALRQQGYAPIKATVYWHPDTLGVVVLPDDGGMFVLDKAQKEVDHANT